MSEIDRNKIAEDIARVATEKLAAMDKFYAPQLMQALNESATTPVALYPEHREFIDGICYGIAHFCAEVSRHE